MKLICLQNNLKKGLSLAGRMVAQKSQLPVLSNVFLSARAGRLRIKSTNLEMGVSLSVGAKIEEEGEITVPYRVFYDYVSSLPADRINLETENDVLKVLSASYEASINGIGASEFPKMPEFKGKKRLKINMKEFIAAVKETSFAAATGEGRPVLTGILCSVKENSLRLVSTDGYRLGVRDIKSVSGKLGDEQTKSLNNLIVPAKAMIELARIASERQEEANKDKNREIEMALVENEGQVMFLIDEDWVFARLIEGEFPDWEKILPTDKALKVEMEVEELQQVIRTASIFARDAANVVRWKIKKTGKQAQLVVSANTPQVGENKARMDVVLKGEIEESEIAFNVRYILDMLGVMDAQDNLVFEMRGGLKPGVFKLKNKSFLHVIMPVRVQS